VGEITPVSVFGSSLTGCIRDPQGLRRRGARKGGGPVALPHVLQVVVAVVRVAECNDLLPAGLGECGLALLLQPSQGVACKGLDDMGTPGTSAFPTYLS